MREKLRTVVRAFGYSAWLLATFVAGAGVASASLADRPVDWYPGTAHVHTTYSQWDKQYGYGDQQGPSVVSMVRAAGYAGLRWVMVTDHEEMFIWDSLEDALSLPGPLEHAQERWALMAEDCGVAEEWWSRYAGRRGLLPLLVMPGEEAGSVDFADAFSSHGHYLTYDISHFADSGTYLECQDMIDAASAAGGFGFIAHPNGGNYLDIELGTLLDWEGWGTTGYTGVEVINADDEQHAYTSPGGLWDQGLTGEVPDRISGVIPSTTHVGIAGSDAHWPQDVDASVTYVAMPSGLTKTGLVDGLKSGRCVATNGPVLVTAEIGTVGIGEQATLDYGEEPTLQVSWWSDIRAADWDLWVRVIGRDGRNLLRDGSDAYHMSRRVSDGTVSIPLAAFTEDGYVRVEATAQFQTQVNKRKTRPTTCTVFTNPIWVKVGPSETRLVDIFPRSVSGENGVYLQYREPDGSYTDLTWFSDYNFRTPGTPWNIPVTFIADRVLDAGIALPAPGVIQAHPSAPVQCWYRRDNTIRVVPILSAGAGGVRVRGQAFRTQGSMRFYIYKGESGFSTPLWEAWDGGDFDLTVPMSPGEALFFAVDAGPDDVSDWSFWRDIRFQEFAW